MNPIHSQTPIRFALLCSLLAACSGSPGGDATGNPNPLDGVPRDPCAIPADARFRSLEQHEVGMGPNGPVLGWWTIDFQPEGKLDWHHSDVVEHLAYHCSGPSLSATDSGGRSLNGALDAAGQLTFDGVVYVLGPAAPLCGGTPNPEGCFETGCAAGQRCDITVGCNPSGCACDASAGTWVCTADCSGGTCVPE